MVDANIVDKSSSFESFGLDDRLLRAVAKLGHSSPTLIQTTAIPLALAGKDLLARAKTGSGKTLAYLLPILHQILQVIEGNPSESDSVKVLILVPTRELAEQVQGQIRELTPYCTHIRFQNVASDMPDKLVRSQLKEKPHVVIGTPSRVRLFLTEKSISLKTSLRYLVVDEADLALSFGYEEDVQTIMSFLPKIVQSFIMSATVNNVDVDKLKQLILRNPAILKLEEDNKDDGNLIEYCVNCTQKDKFLLLYVILKLQLIKGKCLIFVDGIDPCYRLKLFLDQFGIKTCVLNSELPLNTRYHIIQEFNKGVYDYIIASDEYTLQGERDSEEEESEQEEEVLSKISKKRKYKNENDKEYGVARGVDFKNVAAVINFDFPASAKTYTHRIGRTARGGKKGLSLSLVATDSAVENTRFSKVEARRKAKGFIIQPYQFDMRQVSGFRYRAEDALTKVTRIRIREARFKELRKELLNSKKLQSHFEDRPKDLEFLRHDRTALPKLAAEHLKFVPDYLMPKLASVTPEGTLIKHSEFSHRSKPASRPKFNNSHQEHHRRKKTRHDPLKTFSVKPLTKRSRAYRSKIEHCVTLIKR